MNAWLALDIEHKPTRAAGGMHTHGERQDENDALDEAQRAYGRFDADSNDELAVDFPAEAFRPSTYCGRAPQRQAVA